MASCRCKLRAKLMQQKRSADIAKHSRTTLRSHQQQQKQRRSWGSIMMSGGGSSGNSTAADNNNNSSSLLDLSDRSAVTELTAAVTDVSSSKGSRHNDFMRNKVSFGCVEVREYQRSLESDFVDIPYSLCLSWNYEQHDAEPLPFLDDEEPAEHDDGDVDDDDDDDKEKVVDRRATREEGLTPKTRRRKQYRASFSSSPVVSPSKNEKGQQQPQQQHDCVIRKKMSRLLSPRHKGSKSSKNDGGGSSTAPSSGSSVVSSHLLLKRLLRKSRCGNDKIVRDCLSDGGVGKYDSSSLDDDDDDGFSSSTSGLSFNVDESLSNTCRQKLMSYLDGTAMNNGKRLSTTTVYSYCQPTTKEQRLTILQRNGFTLEELVESEARRLQRLDDIRLWSHVTTTTAPITTTPTTTKVAAAR